MTSLLLSIALLPDTHQAIHHSSAEVSCHDPTASNAFHFLSVTYTKDDTDEWKPEPFGVEMQSVSDSRSQVTTSYSTDHLNSGESKSWETTEN